MQANIITNHFKRDRIERAAYISQTVGFGDVVQTSVGYSEGRYNRRELMETGVIIVRNENDVIITMFIATEKQVKAMYKGNKVPQWLMRKVRNNKKYVEGQPKG